ncbi:DsrE family protein [Beggiatoa leptomitoformis]|uniref:Uncharacterized protein n=1 Tax=Beggiatoa leptomitoformis TaxID=288004 RepID=A0A2N9YJ31_9GAMM|nr:DsrE family protein [Beggiatoa leptomitoformis]ALG67349.1 hypothetical protein AL038_06060 [Beggiatoa leptomitoformis]AUI70449.1 hypothetical protein BLE401_18255 [Beggiatoa leptomitoformis]
MQTMLTWLTLACLLFGTSFAHAAETERYGKQKVVYHFNVADSKVYLAALRNIQNHLDAVGVENADIIVVIHGDGIAVVQDAVKNLDLQNRILGLKANQVKFQICQKTLEGHKLDYQRDLFDVQKEDIVPSGVAEIARLEQMGYVYLRP